MQLEEAEALLAAKRLEVNDARARQHERTKEKQALCKALAGNALCYTTALCELAHACHKLGSCLMTTCLPLPDNIEIKVVRISLADLEASIASKASRRTELDSAERQARVAQAAELQAYENSAAEMQAWCVLINAGCMSLRRNPCLRFASTCDGQFDLQFSAIQGCLACCVCGGCLMHIYDDVN